MVPMPDGDDDETIVALLRHKTTDTEHGWGERYVLTVVGMTNHQVDVEVQQDGRTARIRLALPSSQRPMPWLTPLAPANHIRTPAQRSPSAEDWVYDLTGMLNEEMDTGGIAGRAITTDAVGHDWMTIEGYGLRLLDPTEHQRLRNNCGPHGFGIGSRRAGRLDFALEWSLDQVEYQLGAAQSESRSGQQTWQLTSPDGVRLTGTRTDHGQDCDLLARSNSRVCARTAARRIVRPEARW